MRKLIFFVFLLLLIGNVSANAVLRYEIVSDKALVTISVQGEESLEMQLPYDARLFESNSDFEIEEFTNYKLLKVSNADDLVFTYITSTVIDSSTRSNYFIFKNPLEGKSVDIELYLPEGGILKENALLSPDPDSLLTDGKNIILVWNNLSQDEIVVAYSVAKEQDSFWFNVFLILIVAFLIFYVFRFRKLKKKKKKLEKKKKVARKRSATLAKKNYTRNLFGEEKKIIEYLLNKKGNSSWTKEIVKDLGISKVRLSRRLRNLVQKELIEKIPYGNENRIKLLKKR